MKATLHTYCYSVDKPKEAKQYNEMVSDLKSKGLKCFNVLAPHSEKDIFPWENKTFDVDLETSYLFSNQWNTSKESENFPNYRVFDWYEGIYPNKNLKKGHWIEPSQEIKDIRHNTFACGYCGKMSLEAGFCHECVGGEYLSVNDLVMLRKRRIDEEPEYSKNPITQEELSAILPLYHEKQLENSKKRMNKRVAEERQDIADRINSSAMKIDGLLWLIENDVVISGFIFFHHHSQEFSFEVRTKDEETILVGILKEKDFPYKYKVKSK